jgi:hypothetical protein
LQDARERKSQIEIETHRHDIISLWFIVKFGKEVRKMVAVKL